MEIKERYRKISLINGRWNCKHMLQFLSNFFSFLIDIFVNLKQKCCKFNILWNNFMTKYINV